MKLNLNDIHGDIGEYCIACLDKNLNMLNLNENTEKRTLLTTLFNIQFTKYAECPQFLCKVCDIKLNITNNFQQSIQECLILLEEYNNVKGTENTTRDGRNADNLQIEHSEVPIFEDIIRASEAKVKNNSSLKIKSVPLDIVNKAVEDFKNKLAERKTCIICGFTAANRRAISFHMALYHRIEKNNWCLECNNIFENYEEHRISHTSRYQCPFCEQETNVSHYVEHLQSHAGIFKCDTCHKIFKTAAWLEKHKRMHTNDKPYVCPNCSKSFIQISSLRYHVGTHGTFSCDVCKKHYKTEENLQEHECATEIWIKINDASESGVDQQEIAVIENKLVNSTELQNFCKECNKRVKSLSQHLNKCHTILQPQEPSAVKEMQCEYCGKKYSNPYKLKVHIQTHTGELRYKCKYCNKGAQNRSSLKDHERTHTKEKPFTCNVCEKSLSQSSALKTHMRLHTGRPEVCELCNKRFCRKAELRLHLSKHMGEKPFLCTECGRAFAQKSHLTEHIAGHSNARPFQCQYCQKAFKKRFLLKEHIKLHEGIKNFKCPSCSYACYKQYRLQQHMKQHSSESCTSAEETLQNSE